MTVPATIPSWRAVVAPYLFAAVVSTCGAVYVYRLWRADLTIPISYDSDSLLHLEWIKNIVDTGWYLQNDHFGAPGRQDLRGFPAADSLFHLIIRTMAVFTSSIGLLFNLFFLITFPLTTVISHFVLRRFNVGIGVSIVISLLYTFFPYHYQRLAHVFLAAYFLVPLAGLLALRLYQGRPFLARDGDQRGWKKRDWFFAASMSMLLGGGGVYYAFFACYCFVVGSVACTLRQSSWAALRRGACVIACVAISFLGSVAPSLQQRITEGSSADEIVRGFPDAELFGLKVTQLFVPVADHRWGFQRRLAAEYMTFEPLINENCLAALGTIGSIALLVLLARAVVQYRSAESGSRLDGLTLLTLAAVLLGTIGGFGSSFAFFVSPWIRAWNRISIFIAFFALMAVALFLDDVSRRCGMSRRRQAAFAAILLLFTAVGILDQTPRNLTPPTYEPLKARYLHDRDFVRELEALVPKGRMVCQWPRVDYPEGGKLVSPGIVFSAYEHLRPHFHSTRLRWTYGSLRGYEGDLWCKHLDEMPLEDQVLTLIHAEAAGIYIDRSAYADRGDALMKEVADLVGPAAVISRDERLVFFDLTPLVARWRAQDGEDQWAKLRDRALHPVLIDWRKGFFQLQPGTMGWFRWAAKDAELILRNRSQRPARIRFGLSFQHPGDDSASQLKIDSDLFSESIAIGLKECRIEKILDLPPGDQRIRFATSARPVTPGGDVLRRPIVYCVFNFCCEEIATLDREESRCRDIGRLRDELNDSSRRQSDSAKDLSKRE